MPRRSPPQSPDPDERLAWLLEDIAARVKSRQSKFTRWKAVGFWLTGLAAALTAVAGVSVMNEWLSRNAAGALAVTAAIVTALVAAYDPAARTVRVAKERAEWTRLLGQTQDLVRTRIASRNQGHPPTPGELAELTRLWERHCDLSFDDAAARTPR
jgi:predicted aspartyl protease